MNSLQITVLTVTLIWTLCGPVIFHGVAPDKFPGVTKALLWIVVAGPWMWVRILFDLPTILKETEEELKEQD